MINASFENTGAGIPSPLYADDGAIWKRGKNVSNVQKVYKKSGLVIGGFKYQLKNLVACCSLKRK